MLKTQELPGALPPGHPAGALRRAHGPNPYIKGRGTRRDIFRPLPLFFFLNGPAYPYIHDRKKMTRTPPAHFFEPAEWFKPVQKKNPGYAPDVGCMFYVLDWAVSAQKWPGPNFIPPSPSELISHIYLKANVILPTLYFKIFKEMTGWFM